jgi:hypothetical protein
VARTRFNGLPHGFRAVVDRVKNMLAAVEL